MLNKIIKYFLENKLVTILVLTGFVAWGIVTRRERVLNLTLQYAQYQLFTRTLFSKSTR